LIACSGDQPFRCHWIDDPPQLLCQQGEGFGGVNTCTRSQPKVETVGGRLYLLEVGATSEHGATIKWAFQWMGSQLEKRIQANKKKHQAILPALFFFDSPLRPSSTKVSPPSFSTQLGASGHRRSCCATREALLALCTVLGLMFFLYSTFTAS